MFVEHSAEVDIPGQLAAELLAANSEAMEGMGAVAYRTGEELRSRVGPGGLLAKEVVIGVGTPAMSRRGVVIPVRWRATGAEALFPRLEGELSVITEEGDRTQLILRATYRPPLGSVGNLMDRFLLARLAKATVADWVDRIAAWLVEAAASPERQDDLHQRSGADHRAK